MNPDIIKLICKRAKQYEDALIRIKELEAKLYEQKPSSY